MSAIKKSFKFGDHTVTIETGELARQADGAVLVTMSDTVVLVTAVGLKKATPGRDFFPLTVNYQEKTYAAGRIPGGFFKREGRPTEKETLTSRLIDRPIRPLFPEGFINDVQVVASVLSVNAEVDPDIASLLGASAALAISGMPFLGPIGAARVGYLDGKYILNPTATQLSESKLDLVVAGTQEGVLMVESEAHGLNEEIMLGAVMFGHLEMQVAIKAINELAAEAGKAKWQWVAPEPNTALKDAVASLSQKDLAAAYTLTEKQQRYAKIKEVKTAAIDALTKARAMRRRSSPPIKWAANSSIWNIGWCASGYSKGIRESTGATPRPCAQSISAPACWREPTDRRCSRAGKPRRWWSRPSAPGATRKSSTGSPASAKSPSCCITTSLPSASAKPA